MSKIYARWQEKVIKEALKTRRVLLLSGARQCGKTTLAKQSSMKETKYLTLDDITLREAAKADPHSFVKKTVQTLIIDEVQRVPELLSAIKKVVDEDTQPGQYLLTGSANIQSLPSVQESLAGRITKIRLRPLSQGELKGTEPQFLGRAFQQYFEGNWEREDRDRILERAFQGGFPEAILLKDRERRRWHKDYLDALIERDLTDIAKIHRQEAMNELIKIMAAWSSKFMDISSITSKLSIRRPTVESYINALESLYLVERVYPWTKTDYERVGKQTKVFMEDCGLMASILGWNIDQIRLDSDRSGKLIETFIFNELSAQIDASYGEYALFHYRDREQREIDFIIEREDQSLLGIEVKASTSLSQKDFRNLSWFQSHLIGDRDFIGIVLYSGDACLSFGKNLWAVPITVLWA